MESRGSYFEDSYRNNCLEFDDNFSESKSVYSTSKKPSKWTQDEDDNLIKLVDNYGTKNWKKISSNLSNKSAVQCLHRWSKILRPGLTKGPWTIEEDRKLLEWVRLEGPGKWSQCAEFINGRSGKQCRERWFNTLHPDVKKGGWSTEEDFIIFHTFSKIGSKWSKIAKDLSGRTENSIKNRFYSTLRRIATEQKKFNVSPDKVNCEAQSTVTASSSLAELLNYVPQALEEKTRLYQQFKESTSNFSSRSLLYIDDAKEDEKFLNKKTQRSFKAPFNTTNINNTYNVNVSISSQNLMEGLQPKKNENVDDLENAIEKWCGGYFNGKDKSMEILEMKINKMLEKENNNTKENSIDNLKSNSPIIKTENEDLIKNVNNSINFTNLNNHIYNNNLLTNANFLNENNINNCDAINNLLNQLNELEKILHVTKQELFNNYEINKNLIINTNKSNINNSTNNTNSPIIAPVIESDITAIINSSTDSMTANANDLICVQNSKNLLNVNNMSILPNNNTRPLHFDEICTEESNSFLFDYMFKF